MMGIRMELVTSGTLQDKLAEHWCVRGGPQRGALLQEGSLKTDCLDRLELWQRLGAELAEVMACLHGQNPPIVYRDLKPDNVLLRKGHDEQLHVCLTDFGFAKQPTFADPLHSVAGNLLTAAPEVPRPGDPPREYTLYVDNWSLGQTLLCMLWCTYDEDVNGRYPVVPDTRLWEREDDPRVPPVAAKLIKTLTQLHPLRRGTMREACRSPFFTTRFMHMGREFQPVQMQALLDAARR
jgi:serine/threonine protein kinase